MLHQKAATIHFLSKDVGVPWEYSDEKKDIGDKISLTFMTPKAKKIHELEHLVTFDIRLVCTVSTDGLYDISILSGIASALLLLPIMSDPICAMPQIQEVKIEYFDFKHGYKQSLMSQTYESRLRG